MQSLEADSPAPYIALGIPKEEKEEIAAERKENVKNCGKTVLLVIELIFICTIMYISIVHFWISTPVFTYNILVTHEYKEPQWKKNTGLYYYNYPEYDDDYWDETWDNNVVKNFLKEHEDNREDFYEAEDSIRDRLYKMCTNTVPLEWPKEWRDDPQLLTSRMKDDLSFCNAVFNELLDEEH